VRRGPSLTPIPLLTVNQHSRCDRDHSGSGAADHDRRSLPGGLFESLRVSDSRLPALPAPFRRVREVVGVEDLGAKRNHIAAVFSVEFIVPRPARRFVGC